MDRGIKTVISFFIFLFSWGCTLEENPPEYTYMETGVSNVNQGCDIENNRLYYDNVNYTFYQENYRNDGTTQHVTHVRPNDGNTEGTVSQLNLNH